MNRDHNLSPTFGISLEPSWPQISCLELAIRAERLGFSNVWVPDSGAMSPFGDTIVTLAAIASNTKKIKFGSAILNFYTRNPAQLASSFLALSDLGSARTGKQRAILGMGVGSSFNVSKFGVFSRKGMIENLREAIEATQELFKGKEVSVLTNAFKIERVKLSKSKKGKIPIYVGSASPKGLALAGEESDGVILTERIPEEIPGKLAHVELGLARRRSSRKESSGDFEIVNSLVTSVASDRQRALNAAKVTCAYLVAWLDQTLVQKYGIDEKLKAQISSHIGREDESGAAKLVDRKMLDLLTVSGTVEDCIDKCREHLRKGIGQLAFCEPFGPGKKALAIDLIARKIVPRL